MFEEVVMVHFAEVSVPAVEGPLLGNGRDIDAGVNLLSF